MYHRMPAKKSQVERAKGHLVEACRRFNALVKEHEDSCSKKHIRSMKAALKCLEQGISCLSERTQSGGAVPGAIDKQAVITNSDQLTNTTHDPMGAGAMERINAPKDLPQPFSVDDGSLQGGLTGALKDSITPPLGYVNSFGTTQVPNQVLLGGGKKAKTTSRNKRKRA